jgi:hypothetical protein
MEIRNIIRCTLETTHPADCHCVYNQAKSEIIQACENSKPDGNAHKFLFDIFCGIGKTSLMTRLSSEITSHPIRVFVFPTLALVRQYITDYASKYPSPSKNAVVCTDLEFGEAGRCKKDKMFPVYTGGKDFDKFLEGDDDLTPKKVYTTYIFLDGLGMAT